MHIRKRPLRFTSDSKERHTSSCTFNEVVGGNGCFVSSLLFFGTLACNKIEKIFLSSIPARCLVMIVVTVVFLFITIEWKCRCPWSGLVRLQGVAFVRHSQMNNSFVDLASSGTLALPTLPLHSPPVLADFRQRSPSPAPNSARCSEAATTSRNGLPSSPSLTCFAQPTKLQSASPLCMKSAVHNVLRL